MNTVESLGIMVTAWLHPPRLSDLEMGMDYCGAFQLHAHAGSGMLKNDGSYDLPMVVEAQRTNAGICYKVGRVPNFNENLKLLKRPPFSRLIVKKKKRRWIYPLSLFIILFIKNVP